MSLDRLDTAIAFAVIMLGVSLLITILTQMVSAVLGLRGTNLRWGIKTVLTSIKPGLDATVAKDIATKVLQHPIISDSMLAHFDPNGRMAKWTSWWRLASAISSAELVRCLRVVGAEIEAAPAERGKTHAAGAGAGGTGRTDTSATADRPKPVTRAIEEILDDKSDPDMKRRIDLMGSALDTLGRGSNVVVQADKVLERVYATAEASVGKLEAAFNSAMERVSQRFSMQMRLATVCFAVVIALGLHIDSFKLLDRLTENADFRGALVGLSQSMQNEAIAIQGGSVPLFGKSVAPQAHKESMKKLIAGQPETKDIRDEVPEFESADAAVLWLSKRLPNVDPARMAALGAEYRKLVIANLQDRFAAINKKLANAGVQLVESPYPGVLEFGGKRSFLGQLVAAAFLSLGAPFWFNALKSLSSLRSVVAQKQEQKA